MLKEKLQTVPDVPGTYLLKGKKGKVLYVGKANSLRKRLAYYIQSSSIQSPRIRMLAEKIEDFDYVVANSEIEALILENNFIKLYRPRYNVRFVDDKSYLYIKVTVNEEWPRILFVRAKDVDENDGARYFGPFTSLWDLNKIFRTMRKLFQLRNCSLPLGEKAYKPCLDYSIKLCSAPCNGSITKEDYQKNIHQAILFLEGKIEEILDQLEEKMKAHAEKLEFEAATHIRDQIKALKKIQLRQRVVATELVTVNQDVIGLAKKGKRACVQVFFVREGRIIGKEHFLLRFFKDDDNELLTGFITQYYAMRKMVPNEIILPQNIDKDEVQVIQQWLQKYKERLVSIRVAEQENELNLIKLANKNAQIQLIQGKVEEASETSRRILEETKKALGLQVLPHRIEAFDISNIRGEASVGAMSVFINGKPKPSQYRHFKIKTVDQQDDYAMMQEIVWRRYNRVLKEEKPLPNLILIDGGKGHLHTAVKALKTLDIEHVDIIALAKENEEIYILDKTKPIRLPEDNIAILLLRNVRDEAHRFAINYHRKLERKRVAHSVLDEIPGVGKKRKQDLFDHFGSLEKIKAASIEELEQIPSISNAIATTIYRILHP
ncbi:MAG: excinuclease ABC subunit UvrC [Promethearchaeota archaeon]